MKRKVVVVDDSSFMVKKLTDFFTNLPEYEVVATGEDGNEAFELFEKHQPDLLTVDMIMPNANGIEAIGRILEKFPKARILIISAVKGESITDGLRLGAASYMEKPLRFTDPDYRAEFLKTLKEIFQDDAAGSS